MTSMVNTEGLEYLPKNRSCFVYGCFSTAATRPYLGFHKFPVRGKRNIVVIKKNGDKCIYDRRQVWIDALNIGREASLALDEVEAYVCSLHFSKDDFYYNQDSSGKRYLRELAIPRRNLPVRNSSPLTTRFNIRSLNRIKCRGYFSIHNPDGRKLTAPRRFLGANKYKESTSSQSYTKTVWVVRKPKKEETQEDHSEKNDGLENISIDNSFSLVDESQNDNQQVGTDEKDPTVTQQNNPWFTSELIIKEEPISDSEQQSTHGTVKDDDEDDNYEPNLVIQSEDEEEAKGEENQALTEAVELESSLEEISPSHLDEMDLKEGSIEHEVFDEMLPDNFDDTEIEAVDPTILEEYEPTEEESASFKNIYESENIGDRSINGQTEKNYDVTVVNVDDDEEYYPDGEPCNTCGEKYCEDHPEARTEENIFVCLICSEMFPSQKQLSVHSLSHQEMSEEEIEMFEEKTKSLTCEFCGRVLSTKATLREHIMIHTGEKPHECLLCGRCFRHKANLVVHVNGHAVVSTYSCKKCNKAFTKRMDFEKHLKVHVDASGNPLVCKICNAVFKSTRTLYNHSQLHSRKGMVRSKKRHEGPRDPIHVCKICGKVLSTKATLKEHTMIHSGEKPHVCNICGRSIRHKANFVVHVQTHGQGKTYECDMCDEAFMRKSDLTQHKQEVHSKSKLLRCPICSEVFKSPVKFNRHMEMHESVVYMNETEELTGFEPHLLEVLLET